MYKTLRSNAKNFIETLITVQRVKSQFFCDILVAFYTKRECNEALDAQNTPNITNLKYKIIFFLFLQYRNLKDSSFYETSNFP